MRFAFIKTEKALKPPIATVAQLCRALKVSSSGFYAWCARPESARTKDDCLLGLKVAEAHERGRGKYGSPRVHRELKKQGFEVSRKRVIRLMQEQGLVGRPKRRFVATTDSGHQLEVAPNLLERNFTASAPNQRWVGDITYLKTPEGWLYLAVIIDLFSRFVVGWSLSTVIDRHLVLKALEMGLKRRGTLVGAMFHSDRGSVNPYSSNAHLVHKQQPDRFSTDCVWPLLKSLTKSSERPAHEWRTSETPCEGNAQPMRQHHRR